MSEDRSNRIFARRGGLFVVLVAGVVLFLFEVGKHHRPGDWLVWRYAAYLGVAAVWSFAILCAGHAIHRRLERAAMGLLERATMSLGCGLYLFFLLMFVGGLLGLYGWAFALLLPAAMILLGARGARRWVRRSVVHLTRLVETSAATVPTGFLSAGICIGVAAVYFSILSPENPGFDTRWYHLPIAEQYAAQGGIRPFAEGWYLGAYPQLASVAYTWAFLLPLTRLFDRVAVAAHLELFVFLWTLAGTAALAERLLPRGKHGARRQVLLGAAATFLFPSILLYDGGLFTGADHFLAFFCVPLALSWMRLVEAPTAGRAVLFGLSLGAAVVTKYQAAWLIPLPVAVLVVLLGRRRAFGPLVAAGAVAVACASPHWLKNWIAYGNPVYPLHAAWFHSHPWTRDSQRLVELRFSGGFWPAEGTLGEKLAQIGRVLFTFSFEPHDWPTYHGAVPVFGSMFSLLVFTVPFLRPRGRLLWLMAFTYAAIAGWYWVSHQDRYLQAVVPWMAAQIAAIMIQLWKEGFWIRLALSTMAGVQLVWGSGVYFIHARDEHYEIDRPSPLAAAVELLAAGYEGKLEQKLSPYEPWPTIGRALPAGAKALVHERYLRLGLGVASVTDLPGWQGGISYAESVTPRQIYDRLSSFGVTHLIWETKTSHANDSLASDLAFFRFVQASSADRREVSGFTMAKMVEPAAPPVVSGSVVLVDCATPERSGLLSIEEMSEPTERWEPDALPEPRPMDRPERLAGPEELLLVRTSDPACFVPAADQGWAEMARRKDYALWVKTPRRSPLD